MSNASDVHTVLYRTGRVSLTRLEVAAIAGALLAVVSLALPWVKGFTRSATGFEYTWMAPGFVVAAALAIGLAIPAAYRRVRYAGIALIGVLLAAIGVILVLGIPSLGASVGFGLLLFVLGGLLVTGGGYTALVRETSTMKATAFVCVGSLVVLLVGIIAMNGG